MFPRPNWLFWTVAALWIYSAFAIQSATLGYWRFEESAGSVAMDISGNGNNGNLLSGALQTTSVFGSPIPKTSQQNSQSMKFNGVDGCALDMGTGSALDVGTGDFTLEAWVNADSIPADPTYPSRFVAGKRVSGLFGDKGYELYALPSGSGYTVQFLLRAGGAAVTLVSGILSLDTWYHVAAVRSAATMTVSLYINGVLVDTDADTLAGISLNSAQHFSVGGAMEGGGCSGCFHSSFDGFIDEVRLTAGALATNQFLRDSAPQELSEPYISYQNLRPGQTDVSGDVTLEYALTDGDLKVKTDSIQLRFNGSVVAATLQPFGTNAIRILYDPPGTLPPSSTNTVCLIYSDAATPPRTFTNELTFFIVFNNGEPSRVQDAGPGNLIVLEAEHFDRNLPAGNSSWDLVTAPLNFSGDGAMRALPDIGRALGQVVADSPRMDYQVRFVTSGTHFLWIRGLATSSNDDWVLIGIDGQVTRHGTVVAFPKTGNFAWGNTSEESSFVAQVNVPGPGEHLVTVWMSKDGFILDKLLLTTDSGFAPSGTGPPETPRPIPLLEFSRAGDQLTLTWSLSGYVLYENDDPSNPEGWHQVVNGETSPVKVKMGGTGKYYRLMKGEPILYVQDEAVLFPFDEQAFPTVENAQKRLISGTPVQIAVPPGPSGSHDQRVVYYGTVARIDTNDFRMWYFGVGGDSGFRFCYATSQNGLVWTKPNLGLVEYGGSKSNNLIDFPAGPRELHEPVVVMYDPEDADPTRRFKMVFEYLADASWGTAASPDGLRWTVLTSQSQHLTPWFEMSGVTKYRGRYYVTGQGGFPQPEPFYRRLGVYVSDNFVNWEFAGIGLDRSPRVTPPDYNPYREEQIHLGAGLWNRGNVILGVYGQWHGVPDGQEPIAVNMLGDLGLALSHDAMHFTEPVPGFALIQEATSPPSAYPGPAAHALMQGQGMYNVGDQTLCWYAHWGDSQVVVDGWERDRLGYATPETNSARLVSCPIRVAQGSAKVYINAHVDPGGQLFVSLLRNDVQPIPGFENAAFVGDSLRQHVVWTGGDLTSGMGTVRIQLTGSGNWKIYAIYVEQVKP
jgi:hypothetical protein